MKKLIIISKKIESYFTLQNRDRDNIVITTNIKNKIITIIKKIPEKPLFIVFFIHPEEMNNIDFFIENKNKHPDIFYKIIVMGNSEELQILNNKQLLNISDFWINKISHSEFELLVAKAFLKINESFNSRSKKDNYLIELMDVKQDQDDLINIGKALSTEKDPNELIKLILHLSKKITGADAGSIYIIQESEIKEKRLCFKYSHTFNRKFPLQEFSLPIDTNSIAGYVAVTGKVLNIPDVYNLPTDLPISFNSTFDKKNNYKCKSMLVVPMKNNLNQILGVIQIINSKEDRKGSKNLNGKMTYELKLETMEDYEKKVFPFDSRYEGLMEAVAGQAAIAIENNTLINQIQNQFEEFVKASVNAIESRDIATSGHSFRVAMICKEMGRAITNEKNGPLKDVEFSDTEIKEMEYAALLHDFGKVYIDLQIFKKEKKLFSKDYKNLILRLEYLYRFTEIQYLNQELLLSKKCSQVNKTHSKIKNVDVKRDKRLETIKRITKSISLLNEPNITEGNPEELLSTILKDIEQIDCDDIEGNKIELLTENERINLGIKQGTLNRYERKEIENHVLYSYNFANNIPWPSEFKKIPEIILKHHEKLDGSGYPNSLKGKKNIPIQSRIMSIADIYDALIATDRPYKKTISRQKALDILQEEVNNNNLDQVLIDIFIKYKIYNKINKVSFKLTS